MTGRKERDYNVIIVINDKVSLGDRRKVRSVKTRLEHPDKENQRRSMIIPGGPRRIESA